MIISIQEVEKILDAARKFTQAGKLEWVRMSGVKFAANFTNSSLSIVRSEDSFSFYVINGQGVPIGGIFARGDDSKIGSLYVYIERKDSLVDETLKNIWDGFDDLHKRL